MALALLVVTFHLSGHVSLRRSGLISFTFYSLTSNIILVD